jgi:hypothetical protein
MARYVVMEQPEAGSDDDPLFVRDGFHLLAFVVPIVWFAWHGLWIEAIAALAVTLVLSALGTFGLLAGAATWVGLLAALYFGLEAANLRIAALRRRGWREWGVVEADSRAEAETRQAAEIADPAEAAPPPRPLPAKPSTADHGPALGMFGYPGLR